MRWAKQLTAKAQQSSGAENAKEIRRNSLTILPSGKWLLLFARGSNPLVRQKLGSPLNGADSGLQQSHSWDLKRFNEGKSRLLAGCFERPAVAKSKLFVRQLVFPLILLLLFLAGIGLSAYDVSAQQPPTASPLAPTIQPPPIFPPTPTAYVTPVPLLLTPIATPQALPGLPPLTDSRSSKPLAITGNTLLTVNTDNDSVTLLDVTTGTVIAEIPVGDDPRTVAITPDGENAFIALRGDNALAVLNLHGDNGRPVLDLVDPLWDVGHMPYGVLADDRRVYVSNFADDQIAILDRATGEVLYRLDVPDAPAGLALNDDWLLVTHFYSGQVTAINITRAPFVVGTVDVEPDGNLAQSIIIAPDGERAYLPLTRNGLALISLQYQQDWFPVVSVLDLPAMTGDRAARLTLSTLTDASNMPFDAAFSSDDLLYVALAGSDAVLVVDLDANAVVARLLVGANPRGILLADVRAYVLNALDGTVSVIDTTTYTVTDTITVTEYPLASDRWRGKVLFHSAEAPLMSDGAISCATCHFDGGMDRRTWINFRSGPRNTPALGGLAEMPPYNWAGEMAELHDTLEDQVRNVMFGSGLIPPVQRFDPLVARVDAGRSADLDALASYVASLETWPSPYREPDGSLSEAATRGMNLFMSGSPGCSCHAPPLYTDLQQHNLAGVNFSLENYEAFDTPTLRGLWATAPYMHDGVAQTLEELLTRTDPVHSVAGGLTDQQLADLIAFLLSL